LAYSINFKLKQDSLTDHISTVKFFVSQCEINFGVAWWGLNKHNRKQVGVGWLCASVSLCDNIFWLGFGIKQKRNSVSSVVRLGFREWGLGFSKKINKGVVG